MEKMSYREKFVQMNKEAKATWAVMAVLIAFWWITGFGVSRFDCVIFNMPGWFVLSCLGVWVLSIVLVTALTTKVFKNFNLEDDE
ncbi:MAG: YhdT family protein [Synergistaceae bacterium]|nr:YhdT family protein [Synergistaceae bacterium]